MGLVASIPALCGFAGGVLGGVFSDYLIKRGLSLTLARKLPIVLGMLLASTIILCNDTNNTTLVVMLHGAGFLWQRIWCAGLAGRYLTPRRKRLLASAAASLTLGNVASIVTPLVIGYPGK